MLIYDEPLLSGQPPLSGHLPVPWGWSLNRGSTVVGTIACLRGTSVPAFRYPLPPPPAPRPPPRAYLHRLYVHTAVMGLKWKIWKKNISFLKRLVRPASPDFWLALSYVIISLLLFIVNMFATKLLLSSHVCLNPSYRCRWEWVGKARINVKDFSFHDFGDYSNHSKNWKVTKSVVDPPVWEARFRQLFFDVILKFRSVHFLSFAVFVTDHAHLHLHRHQ